MNSFVSELVLLAGPLYFFLQVIMGARYRRRWRVLALVPLVLMLPLAIHAGYLYAAGHPLWLFNVVFAAPLACLYLLGLALVKASVT